MFSSDEAMSRSQKPDRLDEVVIETEAQWRALSDRQALDVYLLLEGIGPCATAELADRLGWMTPEVYRPLRLLLDAMLVRQVGYAGAAAGECGGCSVVDVRADRLVFPCEPSSATPGLSATQLATLASLYAQRQAQWHAAAIERGWQPGYAIEPGSSFGAMAGYLLPDELRAVHEHFEAVQRIFRNARHSDRRSHPEAELVWSGWSVGPVVPPAGDPAERSRDGQAHPAHHAQHVVAH
jgi:hypothetical protein